MILAGVPLEVEIGTWFLSQSLAVAGYWNHYSCPLSRVTVLEAPDPNPDPAAVNRRRKFHWTSFKGTFTGTALRFDEQTMVSCRFP